MKYWICDNCFRISISNEKISIKICPCCLIEMAEIFYNDYKIKTEELTCQ